MSGDERSRFTFELTDGAVESIMGVAVRLVERWADFSAEAWRSHAREAAASTIDLDKLWEPSDPTPDDSPVPPWFDREKLNALHGTLNDEMFLHELAKIVMDQFDGGQAWTVGINIPLLRFVSAYELYRRQSAFFAEPHLLTKYLKEHGATPEYIELLAAEISKLLAQFNR